MVNGIEELTEEEKRALRGSKFAPLPSQPSSSRPNPRIAHPGGPVATNKAVALAKFLERKLQEPSGLDSLNPDLVELAVKKAKETVNSCGISDERRRIRHVSKFDDSDCEDGSSEENMKSKRKKLKKDKKEKKKKKNKKQEKKLNKKNKKLKRITPRIQLS